MSTTTVFVIGAIVFAITVYGVVMAGGALLTEMADADDTRGEDSGGASTS